VCRSGSGAPAELAENLERLIAAQLDLINLVYSCDSPTEARWFSLIALRLPFNGLERVVVLHINISDLVRSPFGASFVLKANADSRDRLLIETQIAASAVHSSVDRSLKSQLNKTLSDQSLRSSINAVRRQASNAELTRVKKGLTKRQQEVFLLLGKGKTNSEIAQTLFRSPNTIKLHVSAILKTLDVENRTQAALLASRLFEQGSGLKCSTRMDQE
jgi:DNA-binding CsgD family transcriptional regulator